MKSNSKYIEETKKKFSETISDLDKYDNKISSTARGSFTMNGIKKSALFNPAEKLEEVKDQVHMVDIMRVKQRMISFTMHSFDKFDLKKILNYWQS